MCDVIGQIYKIERVDIDNGAHSARHQTLTVPCWCRDNSERVEK